MVVEEVSLVVAVVAVVGVSVALPFHPVESIVVVLVEAFLRAFPVEVAAKAEAKAAASDLDENDDKEDAESLLGVMLLIFDHWRWNDILGFVFLLWFVVEFLIACDGSASARLKVSATRKNAQLQLLSGIK